MNNISNIDLECNFNNLRNVMYFNRGKMCDMSSKFWVDKGDSAVDGILKDDKNWWVRMVTDNWVRLWRFLSQGLNSLLI